MMMMMIMIMVMIMTIAMVIRDSCFGHIFDDSDLEKDVVESDDGDDVDDGDNIHYKMRFIGDDNNRHPW